MFWKLVAVILAATVGASTLLALRQQRFEAANQLVQDTCRIDQTRRSLWERQAQLATRVNPRTLGDAVALAQLKLEPLTPLAIAKAPAQNPGTPRVQPPGARPSTPPTHDLPPATVFVSAHRHVRRGN